MEFFAYLILSASVAVAVFGAYVFVHGKYFLPWKIDRDARKFAEKYGDSPYSHR